MTDNRKIDLQDSIDEAWSSYAQDLMSFVSDMARRETLTLTAESGLDRGDGDSPWITLQAEHDGTIACAAVLASYLYEGVEPPAGDDAALFTLGWVTPATQTDVGQLVSRSMLGHRDNADELSRSIVRAFREVWNVAHPAFLSAATEGGSGRQFRTAVDCRSVDGTAVIPLDLDHLRALIVQTVDVRFDLARESNGDIRIDGFTFPVHVCFDHDATSVRIHAPLVTGVSQSGTLSRMMSSLTSRWKNITFVVAGDQLFAGISIDTRTFIPRQLTAQLYRFGHFLEGIDAPFAHRVGGTIFDPTHRHEDPPPPVSWSDDGGTLGTLRAACELTCGPVDSITVDALCRRQDVEELTQRAQWTAHRFRDHAHRLGDDRRVRAAVLCDSFALSWTHVAESLRRTNRTARLPTPRPEQVPLFDSLEVPTLFDMQ
ncbi:hypothetical protein [Rhodococcus sp. H29-C3]|uniref:T3SS (YopN, CesT) and YbjN peptide-binding chaperone 1 n=1 Tax=Rhodococcus sp. H29-C3 TaxID=3046307 RepID=UPI0024B94EE8|nr:hypothetical protein [Rhodococcus sp. H29-C3]MDJ0362351.1 hypothetical protein [Rhodococcus sp. H29-C3]